MKELYPDMPTPLGGRELVEEYPWEVPDEGDTLDFDEWEKNLKEHKASGAGPYAPPIEVPLPPPRTEAEKADDEGFADVQSEKSYIMVDYVEQPDWDDADADTEAAATGDDFVGISLDRILGPVGQLEAGLTAGEYCQIAADGLATAAPDDYATADGRMDSSVLKWIHARA